MNDSSFMCTYAWICLRLCMQICKCVCLNVCVYLQHTLCRNKLNITKQNHTISHLTKYFNRKSLMKTKTYFKLLVKTKFNDFFSFSFFYLFQKQIKCKLHSYRWNSLPKICAIDRPILVLPTPGGPTKHMIGPFKLFFSCRTAKYSRTRFFTFSRP